MFSLTELTEILKALPDPAFILTRSGRYVAVLGGSDARYYHDGSALVGQRISEVLQPEKAEWFLERIAEALADRKLLVIEYGLAGSDVKGLESEGPQDQIWFEGRVQALGFLIEGEEAVLWVASNITHRHELEEKLRVQSATDALTGLWNRRHFEAVARQECERALRYGHPLSVLIFDIDHFKSINDSCGHEIGDLVLRQLADTVRSCTRESDVIARWGGDEFVVLMPHAGPGEAQEAAEHICQSVARQEFAGGLKISLSIGVAQWLLLREQIENVIARADEALYTAKSLGRNQVALADESPFEAGVSVGPMIWRRHFECGHAQIDEQHRRLFHYLDQLNRFGAEDLPDVLDQLIEEVQSHFRFEEHILGEAGWAELEAHQAEHADLLKKVAQLREQMLKEPGAATLGRLVHFLSVEVVANHLLRADRAFHSLFRRSA